MDTDTKHCKDCDTTKTHAEFYNDKRRPDGKTHYCRACLDVRAKAYCKTEARKIAMKRYNRSVKGKARAQRMRLKKKEEKLAEQ